MKIGVCIFRLRFPENGSLKDKRRLVKSLLARASNKFNIAIAEVGDQDIWQATTIGFSCVGNDALFVNEVAYKAINFLELNSKDAELQDFAVEILDAF